MQFRKENHISSTSTPEISFNNSLEFKFIDDIQPIQSNKISSTSKIQTKIINTNNREYHFRNCDQIRILQALKQKIH